MLKAICLALILLSGMTAALALRPHNSAASGAAVLASHDLTTAIAEEPDDAFSVNTSSKADRLPSAVPGDETKKLATSPIAATPIRTENKSERAKPQITSWHWHAGSKKVTRK
jgi:hypothetical protein